MLERFTDRARKVMALANQEAQRFNHDYIDPIHILMGLIKEGSGVGANVLMNAGVSLKEARIAAEKIVKPGPNAVTMGKLPQTPVAKAIIVKAIEEAKQLNHRYVGTEHLLLGLLGVESTAMQVLSSLGVDAAKVRAETIKLLTIADTPETLGFVIRGVNPQSLVDDAKWCIERLGSKERSDKETDLYNTALEIMQKCLKSGQA